MEGKIASRIRALLLDAAEINELQIDELEIMKDHIHMLVQLRPKVSVAKAVQIFKGGSSRVLRKEFPEIKEFLWGDSFWADGYFSETVGVVDEKMIRKYIQNQKEPGGL